jgi:hypothetical protein
MRRGLTVVVICRWPVVVSARCRAAGWRQQDAEFVAVRVSEDVPAPSVFGSLGDR